MPTGSELVICKSRSTAERRCPWAAVIARCAGGYIAFADRKDYDIWRNAK